MNCELDVNCDGCDIPLTIDNVGGYRCFCQKCVDVMPELPKEGNGFNIVGKYPNFEWVEVK